MPPPGTPPPPYGAPPPYPAPSAYAAPVYAGSPRTDGMAIASLIVSLIALPGLICYGVPGLILGAVGFFLGRASLNRIRGSGGMTGGQGVAQAGWIIGVIAAALGALIFVIVVIVFAFALSSPRNTA